MIRIGKFLAVLCLLVSSFAYSQTVTVSGHISQAFGTVLPGGTGGNAYKVCFGLRDGNNQSVTNARIVGTGGTMPLASNANSNCVTPDSSGAFSTALVANDQIESLGTVGGTQWAVFIQKGNSFLTGSNYVFNLADITENLDTKPPTNTVPLVPSPTGDTTYCRLIGCTLSGVITAPSATITALSASSASVSGAINGQSLDNTIFADQIAGADMCAKITAAGAILALRAIPTGIIDARGFIGTQACATAPVLTVASGLLMLGNVNIPFNSASSAWTIPHGWFVIGPWQRADGSGNEPGLHFQAVTGFPTSTTAMITVGSATPFDEGPTLMNAWVDCNGIASKAITSSTINEKGGIKRVLVTECTGTPHVGIVSGGSGSPQNFVIDELEILSTATNEAGNTGLAITGSGNSFGQVSNITVVGKSASKFQNGVTFDSWTGGKAFHIHVEQAVDAITVCLAAGVCNGGSFDDITGDPGVTNSILHIKTGTAGSHFTSISQQGTPGTTAHTIIDDVNTLNYNGFTIPSFDASTSTEQTTTHYLTADKATHSALYDDNNAASATSGVYNAANNKTIVAARKADNSGDIPLLATDNLNDATLCGANCTFLQLLAPFKLGAGDTITQYNGVSTVANGIPVLVAKADATAQAANITATTLLATGTSPGAGMYRFSCYIVTTQAATSSSTLPACNVTFTDNDTNVSQGALAITATATNNIVGISSTGTGGAALGMALFNAHASTNISYSTTGYVSSGVTPMQYAIHVKLEYLGN